MRPMNAGNGHGRGLLGPGPLMTGHLKVRNLDRELEMLRRKREIIQREQEILNMECDLERKRQYGQTNRNVSNMFGNVWDPPPPKRANVPQQMQPWRDAPRDAFPSHMPKPLPSNSSNYIPSLMEKKIHMPRQPVHSAAPILKPIIHPILLDGGGNRMFKPALKPRNDYRSVQVPMKKKPQAPPNKLNSYPVNVRKNLVSKALDKSAIGGSHEPAENAEAMVLRDDEKPDQRVIGRLELALGNIFKEIRQSNSDNTKFKHLVSTNANMRIVKQEIRERLRTVMLNQTVTSSVDIYKKYRERFPKKTDKDIVDLLIDKCDRPKPSIVIETESPTNVFNENIDSIFEKKLREMSTNLLSLYTGQHFKSTLSFAKADYKKKEENKELTMKILRNITNKYVTADEKKILTKYYVDLIEDILEIKLLEYLPKCKEQFLKIFELDDRMKNVIAGTTKKTEEKQSDADIVVVNEESIVINLDAEPESNEMGAEINEINETMENENNKNIEIQQKDDTQNEVATKNGPNDKNAVETNKTKDLEATEAAPIEVEQSLKPTTGTSVRPTNIDPKTSQGSNKTQAPTGSIEPTTPINKADTPSTTNTPVTPSTPQSKDLLYYIKLIGKPNLPTRPVICEFLNSYQPTSIKKHKSINNLLVIGFNNLNSYNQILKANETVIGDITIIIKGSEKINAGKENESLNKSNGVQKADVKEMNDKMPESQNVTDDKEDKDGKCATNKTSNEKSPDKDTQKEEEAKDIIGKDLDDQITDLLTTIRETEEEVTEKGEAENDSEVEKTKEIELPEKSTESDKSSLGTIKEDEVEMKNGDTDKVKSGKSVVTGAATPARSSSRLANVTPSSIRTRRASRLLQE